MKTELGRGRPARLVPVLAVLLLAGVTASARAAGCTGPAEPMKLATVVRGVLSGLEHKVERVVRSETEWRELWSKLGLPLRPAVAAPAIDFTRSIVVLVAAGQGQGVIEVEVTGVARRSGCVVVTVVERGIPAKFPAEQFASFRPFHVVRIDRDPGSVTFRYVKQP